MTDDARIAALFATPAHAPDEAFVRRMERVIAADRRLQAERAKAWRRFAIELAATGAVVTAFLLLGRIGPAVAEAGATLFGPAMAGALLLACWLAVEMRPARSRRMPEGL